MAKTWPPRGGRVRGQSQRRFGLVSWRQAETRRSAQRRNLDGVGGGGGDRWGVGWGVGCGVWGVGCGVWGVGCGVCGWVGGGISWPLGVYFATSFTKVVRGCLFSDGMLGRWLATCWLPMKIIQKSELGSFRGPLLCWGSNIRGVGTKKRARVLSEWILLVYGWNQSKKGDRLR